MGYDLIFRWPSWASSILLSWVSKTHRDIFSYHITCIKYNLMLHMTCIIVKMFLCVATVNGKSFAGLNFRGFHGFQEYRRRISVNISAPL